ncbi:MAG TPA: hypothetical protein VEQ11_04440 [Chloroflexota bacterium]|nr:hypothetical protein [Chloroflexota bacterium]
MSTSTVTTEELVGRLEAMAARLEEQQAEIAQQRAEIARLHAERSAPTAGAGQAESAGQAGGRRTTDRRGLLRGLLAAGAAVTGLWAGGARPAQAGGTDHTALIIGETNTESGTTRLNRPSGAIFPDPALSVFNDFGNGVEAEGSYYGLRGFSRFNESAGVYGFNSSTDAGAGVIGAAGVNYQTFVDFNVGVAGYGSFFAGPSGVPAYGVLGEAYRDAGVLGKSTLGVGTRGDSTNSSGVIGRATGPSNAQPGVVGSATNGYGVFGFSQNSNGIAGQSGGGAAGCVGFAGAAGGYGIYGGTAVAGGYAGGFAGPVLVVGDFTATGGAKSAAVPHPDGTHRRLYCMESPESWFEDAADGKLVNGRAQVTLDPDFAVVVHNDKYLIYLTPEGDCKGLYVSSKNASGFEVRELQGGTSSLSFNYRVMARRKDIPGPRLEKIKLPVPIKELVRPAEPPKGPELPKPSEPPRSPEPTERPAR